LPVEGSSDKRIAAGEDLFGLHRQRAERRHGRNAIAAWPSASRPSRAPGARKVHHHEGRRETAVHRDGAAHLAAGGAGLRLAEQQRAGRRIALDHGVIHFGVAELGELLGRRRMRRRAALGDVGRPDELGVRPRLVRRRLRGSDPTRPA
jgi:hypothetical protein